MSYYVNQDLLMNNLHDHYEANNAYQNAIMDEACMIAFNQTVINIPEVKQDEALLPVTAKELSHLINDLIAYIWKLEDKEMTKEEFGYFSRKALLEKLQQFEKNNFQHNSQPEADGPAYSVETTVKVND